ncbi:hypothetical protein AB0H76_33970 [Nocardia sp. NPDC050712]|uniref:hypothetical protein n=1 Tax=Nocardia sp. NPDC050712 TaxID=3155518 RepID=UPI0033CC3E6D
MDQAASDMAAHTVAAFHSPDSVPELPASGDHFGVSGLVGPISSDSSDLAGVVDDFDSG